jgi:membrane protein YqaA with SNARE-associated domain
MKNINGKRSVLGFFKARIFLDDAVDELKAQNFRNSDISILVPRTDDILQVTSEKNTKAPEGLAVGVTAGSIGGGVLGWLIGAEALAITGFGALIAAGSIVAAIAGVGVGGTLGGIVGGLIGLGIPEFEARRYEEYVNDGRMLLIVHVDDYIWEEKAKKILEANGAQDVAITPDDKADRSTYYDKIKNHARGIEDQSNTLL